MKVCRTCGVNKPIDQYRQVAGRKRIWCERQCKSCNTKARIAWARRNPEKTRQATQRYRERHLEELRAYNRVRNRQPDRLARINERARLYEQTEEGKRQNYARVKRWRAENPEKYVAHTIVGNAVRDGKIVKGSCVLCGVAKNVDAHHDDYTAPLDVTWLCRKCHGATHREINEMKREILRSGTPQ